jgi:uncharacterized protein YbaP (TraB family)
MSRESMTVRVGWRRAAQRTLRRFLPVALLTAALLAPQTGAARERHVLWAVEGTHNTVYLLGSLHVLRPQDGQLAAAADAAYVDAERLVMEIDMDDVLADPSSLVAAMESAALLPEGQTLSGVLGADYERVADRAKEVGLRSCSSSSRSADSARSSASNRRSRAARSRTKNRSRGSRRRNSSLPCSADCRWSSRSAS